MDVAVYLYYGWFNFYFFMFCNLFDCFVGRWMGLILITMNDFKFDWISLLDDDYFGWFVCLMWIDDGDFKLKILRVDIFNY